MMRAYLLLVVLGWVVGVQAQPASLLDDPVFQAEAQRGLDDLYSLRFEAAQQTFDGLAQRYPAHPAGPFLQALVPWWQILLDLSDERRDQAFFAAMDETIARSDRLLRRNRRDTDALFFKGAALAFRGRLHGNRRQYVRAARDANGATDLIFDLAARNPQNADFGFGKGIYDYYAAELPRRHRWARPFMTMFPDGDKGRGLAALHRTYRHGRYLKTEAAYFLVQIYYLYERNEARTRPMIRWLRTEYPENAFFHALEGRIYAGFGHWDESATVFRDVLRRADRGQTGYNDALKEQALFHLGRHEMLQGRYPAALAQFDRLERVGAQRSAQTYYEVLGRLRQGMTLDALGQRAQAVQRYQQVLRMRDVGGAHERARFYLRRAYRG